MKENAAGTFIFGHEYAGEVVHAGEHVTWVKPGDRVAVEPHKGCGHCLNCIRGNYTLCLNYGNHEEGHFHYGFTANGGYAEYIVNVKEKDAYQEVEACTGGKMADTVFEVSGSTSGGSLSVQLARKGGRVALVGSYSEPVPMDAQKIVLNGLHVTGSRGEGNAVLEELVPMFARGDISTEKLITHIFPLEKIHEAFSTFMERQGHALKVVVTM